jgi:hypothetical protein
VRRADHTVRILSKKMSWKWVFAGLTGKLGRIHCN